MIYAQATAAHDELLSEDEIVEPGVCWGIVLICAARAGEILYRLRS